MCINFTFYPAPWSLKIICFFKNVVTHTSLPLSGEVTFIGQLSTLIVAFIPWRCTTHLWYWPSATDLGSTKVTFELPILNTNVSFPFTCGIIIRFKTSFAVKKARLQIILLELFFTITDRFSFELLHT